MAILNNSIHSSKAHFHNEISIGLIERGRTQTEINGNIYELHEKTFLIIPFPFLKILPSLCAFIAAQIFLNLSDE